MLWLFYKNIIDRIIKLLDFVSYFVVCFVFLFKIYNVLVVLSIGRGY